MAHKTPSVVGLNLNCISHDLNSACLVCKHGILAMLRQFEKKSDRWDQNLSEVNTHLVSRVMQVPITLWRITGNHAIGIST